MRPESMSRRKRGAVVTAVLAALVCVVVLRGRCSSGAGDAAPGAAGELRWPGGPRRPAAVVDPGRLWSLYGQRNVARRRIAGQVRFEGRPFAGARVSLRWLGMEARTLRVIVGPSATAL